MLKCEIHFIQFTQKSLNFRLNEKYYNLNETSFICSINSVYKTLIFPDKSCANGFINMHKKSVLILEHMSIYTKRKHDIINVSIENGFTRENVKLGNKK